MRFDLKETLDRYGSILAALLRTVFVPFGEKRVSTSLNSTCRLSLTLTDLQLFECFSPLSTCSFLKVDVNQMSQTDGMLF